MYTNMMKGRARVNQPVATLTMASVVTMLVMQPRNWMMMPGRMVSMVSVSRENLLITRPLGVVSKKDIGNLMTRFNS